MVENDFHYLKMSRRKFAYYTKRERERTELLWNEEEIMIAKSRLRNFYMDNVLTAQEIKVQKDVANIAKMMMELNTRRTMKSNRR